jgi:hypothetical protein
MAKRAAPAEPADKELTLPEIHLAIRRLERRVADLEAFDPTQIGTQRDPKILDLEAAIKETLSDVFGYNTRSYRTYMAAAALDTAGMNSNGTPLHEVIEGLVRGKERSLSLLRRAARSFQERIEDDPDYHNARAGTAMAGAAMAGYGGGRSGDSLIAPLSAEINASIGEFSIQGGDVTLTVQRAPATMIVTAVRLNQAALQLAALSLLASLDAKLEQLRSERSNSEDPAQFEDLKRRVEEFLAASSSKDEVPIVETSFSLADGLGDWWNKDHVNICTKALNMGLFAGGLSICAAAGVLGPLSVVTVGTLIAGKNFSGALEACAKLLKRD